MSAWTQLFEPGPALILLIALIVPQTGIAAPVNEHDTTNSEYYPIADSTGCYYNFQHYDEGDRIITNEPCLNCTCHNRMLMCYLRVCPFTKAIGQDCKVEKRADQCCPVITCPEVPVHLLTSTTQSSTALGHPDAYGCSIEGLFYSDGARVPSDPNKPCELCYCIRNKTACVMQECTLKVEGCKPVYQEGVCCPVRYDCEHPDYNLLETTTKKLLTTTTPATTTLPGPVDCIYNNEVYADGALIIKEKPCEHCYCMKGDIVCAVQECSPTPLDKVNCTALPPKDGQCCPDTYECEHMTDEELTTGYYYTTPSSTSFEEISTTHPETKPQEVEEETVAPVQENEITRQEGSTEQTTALPGKEGEVLHEPVTVLPDQKERPSELPETPEKEDHEEPFKGGITPLFDEVAHTTEGTEQATVKSEEPITTEKQVPSVPQRTDADIPQQEENEIPEEHEFVTAGPPDLEHPVPSHDDVEHEESEYPESGSGEGIGQVTESLPSEGTSTEVSKEPHIPQQTTEKELPHKVESETERVTQRVFEEGLSTEIPSHTTTQYEGAEKVSTEKETLPPQVTESDVEGDKMTEIPHEHVTSQAELEEGEQPATLQPKLEGDEQPVTLPEQVTSKPKEAEKPEISTEKEQVTLQSEIGTTEHPHVIQHVTEIAPEIGTGLPHEMPAPGTEKLPSEEKAAETPEEQITQQPGESQPQVTEAQDKEIRGTETPQEQVTLGETEEGTEQPAIEQVEQGQVAEVPQGQVTEGQIEEGTRTESPHEIPDESEVTETPQTPVTIEQKSKSTEVPQEQTTAEPVKESTDTEIHHDAVTEEQTKEGESTETPLEQVTVQQIGEAAYTEKPQEISTFKPAEEGTPTQVPQEMVTVEQTEEGKVTQLPHEFVTTEEESVGTELPKKPVIPGEGEESKVTELPQQQTSVKQTEEGKEQGTATEEAETEFMQGPVEHVTDEIEEVMTTVKPQQATESHIGRSSVLPQEPVTSIETEGTELPQDKITEHPTEEFVTEKHLIESSTTTGEMQFTEEKVEVTELPDLTKQPSTESSVVESESTESVKGTTKEESESTEEPKDFVTESPATTTEKAEKDHVPQVSEAEGATTVVPPKETETPIDTGKPAELPEEVTELPEEISKQHTTQQTEAEVTEITEEQVTKQFLKEQELEAVTEMKETATDLVEEHVTESGVPKATELPFDHVTYVQVDLSKSTESPQAQITEKSSEEETELPLEYSTPSTTEKVKPTEEPQLPHEDVTKHLTDLLEPEHIGTEIPQEPETKPPGQQVKVETEVPEEVATTESVYKHMTEQPVEGPQETATPSEDKITKGTEVPQEHITEGKITELSTEHTTEKQLYEPQATTVKEEEHLPEESEGPEQYPVEQDEVHLPEEPETESYTTQTPKYHVEVTEKQETTEHAPTISPAPSAEGETEKSGQSTTEIQQEPEIIVPEKETEAPLKTEDILKDEITTIATELERSTQAEIEKEESKSTLPAKEAEEEKVTEIPQKPVSEEVVTVTPQPAHVTPGIEEITGKTQEPTSIQTGLEESTEKRTSEEPATDLPDHGEPDLKEITTSTPVESGEPSGEITEQPIYPSLVHDDLETTSEEDRGIPGEGSCLVDGQTYKNNSNVPPINPCQISCKCVSSILQCESVTCTPPPSNLQHCMPVYQGPDSCCPTYSCTVPGVTSMESDSHKVETTTREAETEKSEGVTIIIPSQEGTIRPEGTTALAREETEYPIYVSPTEQVPYTSEEPIPGQYTGLPQGITEETASVTELPTKEVEKPESTEGYTSPKSEITTEIPEVETEKLTEKPSEPSQEYTPPNVGSTTEIPETGTKQIIEDHAEGEPETVTGTVTELPETGTEQITEKHLGGEPEAVSETVTDVPETGVEQMTEKHLAGEPEIITEIPETVTEHMTEKHLGGEPETVPGIATEVSETEQTTEKQSEEPETVSKAATEISETEIEQVTEKHLGGEPEAVPATEIPEAGTEQITEKHLGGELEAVPATEIPETGTEQITEKHLGGEPETETEQITEKPLDKEPELVLGTGTEIPETGAEQVTEQHLGGEPETVTGIVTKIPETETEQVTKKDLDEEPETVSGAITELPETEQVTEKHIGGEPQAAAATEIPETGTEQITEKHLGEEPELESGVVTEVPETGTEQVAEKQPGAEPESVVGAVTETTETEKVTEKQLGEETGPTSETVTEVLETVTEQQLDKEMAETEKTKEDTTPKYAGETPKVTDSSEHEVLSTTQHPADVEHDRTQSSSEEQLPGGETNITEEPTVALTEVPGKPIVTSDGLEPGTVTTHPVEHFTESSVTYASTVASESDGITKLYTEPTKKIEEGMELVTEIPKTGDALEGVTTGVEIKITEEATERVEDLTEIVTKPSVTESTTSSKDIGVQLPESISPTKEEPTHKITTLKPEESETATVPVKIHVLEQVTEVEGITEGVSEGVKETVKPVTEESVTEEISKITETSKTEKPTTEPSQQEMITEGITFDEGAHPHEEQEEQEEEEGEPHKETSTEHSDKEHVTEAQVSESVTTLRSETATDKVSKSTDKVPIEVVTESVDTEKMPESISHVTEKQDEEVTTAPQVPDETSKGHKEESEPSETGVTSEIPSVPGTDIRVGETEKEKDETSTQTTPVLSHEESIPTEQTPESVEAVEKEVLTTPAYTSVDQTAITEKETEMPVTIKPDITTSAEGTAEEITDHIKHAEKEEEVFIGTTSAYGHESVSPIESMTEKEGEPSVAITSGLPEYTSESKGTTPKSVEPEQTSEKLTPAQKPISESTEGTTEYEVTATEGASVPSGTEKPEDLPEKTTDGKVISEVSPEKETELPVPGTEEPVTEAKFPVQEQTSEIEPAATEIPVKHIQIDGETTPSVETELSTKRPVEGAIEVTFATTEKSIQVPTTVQPSIGDEGTTEKERPAIPGEGQQPAESIKPIEESITETSSEGKPEEIFTSPTLVETTPSSQINISTEREPDLFTSGPSDELTTQRRIPGELSTSATAPPLTSSTTLPPQHHEEPDYQTPVEEDYGEEDQSAFGPGTCRYGGKVYVSAQQIPRDDPCDFCFCFRSDIICLQQSCPPPIPRCHEEPIRGFCCPRYECPVSMATTVNITTTTTTTTTTLPPHFLSHAYKGRASRSGCQIQNKAYNVGEEIKSASGPCLHCTCGGNGQMKCDPKACSPEPMLRQMIAAAESRRRR